MEPPALDDPVTLHPAALKTYEDQLMELRDAMQERVEGGYPRISECLRELVASIVVRRGPQDGRWTSKSGASYAVSWRSQAANNRKKFVGGGLVAEEGFEPPTQGL